MWCAWNTGWPACSSCASRASPAPCGRRRTWGSWTCLRYSALMSPVRSYPPSRWKILEGLLHANSRRFSVWSCKIWGMRTCFLLSVQQDYSPFPVFVLAPNPWPQQHPWLCQLSHSWEREAALHHEASRRQPGGGRALLHTLPGILRRTGAYSQRKTHQ